MYIQYGNYGNMVTMVTNLLFCRLFASSSNGHNPISGMLLRIDKGIENPLSLLLPPLVSISFPFCLMDVFLTPFVNYVKDNSH